MTVRMISDRCRWGAIVCVCIFSLVLVACGGDDGPSNDTSNDNADAADAGHDADSGAESDGGDEDGGNGDEDGGNGDDGIEIAGTYVPDYDDSVTITITDEQWSGPGGDMPIVEYDNDDNWAVTEDDSEDASTFSKNVWTEPEDDGSLYYCTVVFGEASADDAREAEGEYDDSDPESGGCGADDFPWTGLTPE